MGWEILTDTALGGVVDRYNDITVRRERIWSVSASGRLVRFTQGGWLDVMGFGGHLRCIGFDPTGQVGWMGLIREDAGPRLMKSTDGGVQWLEVTSLPSVPQRGLCGLSVLNARTAFACGTFDIDSAPGVLRTANGADWTALELPRDITNLTDILFWTAHTGLVAGGTARGPVILLTHDGGETWEQARIHGDLAERSYGWKLFFVNGVTGYASVAESIDMGMVLRTDDSGMNWRVLALDQPKPPLSSWDLQGIGFVDENHGWVCQHGAGAFETIDGGNTWKPAPPILQNLNRIQVTRGAVFASGNAIYRLPL